MPRLGLSGKNRDGIGCTQLARWALSRPIPMDLLTFLQWPAMGATVTAAWLVASPERCRRFAGFGCYLASNVLWVSWGLHADAFALILLQIVLVVSNLRGLREARPGAGSSLRGPAAPQPQVQVPGGEGVAVEAEGAEIPQATVRSSLGHRHPVVGLPHRDQPFPSSEAEGGKDLQGGADSFRA